MPERSVHDLRFDLDTSRDADSQTLQVTFDVDATPAQVWQALTDADQLVSWFPLQAKVEPGPEGAIWISWDGHFDGSLRVLDWQPDSRLRTTWPVVESATEDSPPVETVLEWRIEEREGGGATVRVVHSGFPLGDDWEEIFDSHRRGWTYELQSLRHYLGHHGGKRRAVARVRRQVPGRDAEEIWSLLFSPAGLLLDGSVPLERGRDYAFTLPSKHRLEGRVLVATPPTDFGATVTHFDGLAGSESSMFRVAVESWSGPGSPLEVHLWLATWGVAESDVQAIRTSWEQMLDGLLARAAS